MLCNSTETQTKPTINREKKQHLTPGFNQVTPSITDFQETHECAHTHVRAHNTHQKKNIKNGNKYHKDQQNQTVMKLYSLISSRNEFLLS